MKAFISRGAIVASALLVFLVAFSAKTSIAETALLPFQGPTQGTADSQQNGTVSDEDVSKSLMAKAESVETVKGIGPATPYVATAYSLRGRTASGRYVSRGLIAADPRFLPLGSRVRLDAGGYSGEYLVADTGGLIKGRRIDIWIPSSREAMKFGRRSVKLTVLSYPQKRARRTPKA
jgi:3D (Asp-Asp-Asp) domain-containing protein